MLDSCISVSALKTHNLACTVIACRHIHTHIDTLNKRYTCNFTFIKMYTIINRLKAYTGKHTCRCTVVNTRKHITKTH